ALTYRIKNQNAITASTTTAMPIHISCSVASSCIVHWAPPNAPPWAGETLPQLIAEVLSDSAVVRPAPPRLEGAATQHNDKPGANYDGEHEINSAHGKASGGERKTAGRGLQTGLTEWSTRL